MGGLFSAKCVTLYYCNNDRVLLIVPSGVVFRDKPIYLVLFAEKVLLHYILSYLDTLLPAVRPSAPSINMAASVTKLRRLLGGRFVLVPFFFFPNPTPGTVER